MQPGSVIVDLAIADRPAFATTPRTEPGQPVAVDGVLHIGVPNFAGLVPRTASAAFSAAGLDRILLS